ncbi:MAG TPA: proline--tRNA ligase [Ruminococcaceae bacterium]|nr:proline--tRNA ligase [Oscillospiraceae bacterium]
MAKNGKKKVEAITSMEVDFAKWYTDIVKKAELIDYSSMRGCMILRPYGYAIWENIQKILDAKLKATGHENVYMPMFIPESLLQKEKDHVEGFAPEVAWVTQGGGEKLEERLCVRPTSETLFCEHYAHIIHSYRDLPKLYNQWCSVVRWEKTTRPFLRSLEFLWQEGHTMHETAEEARNETTKMLNVYADFCEKILAMPVIKGQKTEKEKFSGAEETYSIESLMHDGKALQSGTSHYFGDGFAKAFDIQFTGRDNTLQHPFQTSWGVTTRLIGAIIMVHGDDNGLVLPPKIAPLQVIVVPIASKKPGVLEKAHELRDRLQKAGISVQVDETDNTPGWKFAEHEMKGVPLRLEIGPRDIENNHCIGVRRDDGQKSEIALDHLEDNVSTLLDEIQVALYQRALKRRDTMTYVSTDMESMVRNANEKPGFIKAMWCGDRACEDKIREVAGLTSRNIPFEQEHLADTCICCGRPAKHMVYWGKAY